MKIKISAGERTFAVINTLFLLLLVLITAYPLYYILMGSLSDPHRFMTSRGVILLPKGFSIQAYTQVLQNSDIISGYKNTLIYVVLGTTINVFLTTLGAYSLSRNNVKLSKFFMMLIMVTMYFGGGLIPTFLLIQNLNMLNTLWVMVIPNAISAWNLIIMRTSFKSMPASLEEAARIDGANDFGILFKIFVPLSLPIISVITLFYSVGHWNSWFGAMIYLVGENARSKFPLQLILREILITNSTEDMMTGMSGDKAFLGETIKYATIIISILPIFMVYPFLQRYFTTGVMIGAIKE